MKLMIENTMEQYETMFKLPEEKRENYFRYTMMGSLEKMWNIMRVPMKASQAGAYDVVMATKMLGYLDVHEVDKGRSALDQLKAIAIDELTEHSLQHCLRLLGDEGLLIESDSLLCGTYLADPIKLAYTKGYSGFGGIPGYIQLLIYPNDYNIPRIPAILAHELHHNVRFSYFNWDHGNVTLGDYLVIEGLADSFASAVYGEQMLGPWVTDFDEEDLHYSIEVMHQVLELKGFAEIRSYMFGDEIAKEQGYQPVGLSYAAGYAVGYHVVQAFLNYTGVTIYEATRLSTKEIIEGSKVFV